MNDSRGVKSATKGADEHHVHHPPPGGSISLILTAAKGTLIELLPDNNNNNNNCPTENEMYWMKMSGGCKLYQPESQQIRCRLFALREGGNQKYYSTLHELGYNDCYISHCFLQSHGQCHAVACYFWNIQHTVGLSVCLSVARWKYSLSGGNWCSRPPGSLFVARWKYVYAITSIFFYGRPISSLVIYWAPFRALFHQVIALCASI